MEERKNSQKKQNSPVWADQFIQEAKRLKESPTSSQNSQYLTSINDHINLKIIGEEDELFSEEGYFHPNFTNQVFNDEETITGYRELNIDIFLTPVQLRPYVNITFEKKQKKADELEKPLKGLFVGDFTTKLEEFQKWLEEERKSKPVGECIAKETRKERDGSTKAYEVYKVSLEDIDFQRTTLNMQALFLFFIDGASFIENDPFWKYYILYETPKIKNRKEHRLIGYATTYDFHQNLKKCRTRISQYLILPCYQRMGYGTLLLRYVYDDILNNDLCFEITVEDPSDEFQSMRDIFDIKLILKHGFFSIFKEELTNFKKDKIISENFHLFKLTQEERREIHKTLKLTESRVVRCFELLKFAKLASEDKEVLNLFRVEVKKREMIMNKDFFHPGHRYEKIQKKIIRAPFIYLGGKNSLDKEEANQISKPKLIDLPLDERKEKLSVIYEEIVRQYSLVKDKLGIL